MSQTASTIIAIIAEKALLDPGDLTPNSQLADLGVDSLGMVEAIFAMEEAFDISIPFNVQDASVEFDISSIGSIISGIERLIAQKPA